jgi:hypothetical protein
MRDDDARSVGPISERQFELYALSLERGPNFYPAHIFAAYEAGHGNTSGCILIDLERGAFATVSLRRRVDHCWVRSDDGGPFDTPEAALAYLRIAMRPGEPPEPVPPRTRRRRQLMEVGPRGISPEFELLSSSTSHFPALMAVGECYLALPNPDANFVTDLQTNNFASRIFELYLLGSHVRAALAIGYPLLLIEMNASPALPRNGLRKHCAASSNAIIMN